MTSARSDDRFACAPDRARTRARGLGVCPGILEPGPLNAITDVADVRVGHLTLIGREGICTGVTAILPHGRNPYQDKVPAGVVVGNGYGKMMGASQIAELGEIETPIVLTNTLAVPHAADGILDWILALPGNEDVRSVNPVVGETNDGYLNNIRQRAVSAELVRCTIERAQAGAVDEGSVGAGTGTLAFGWKGGIGTSSRLLPGSLGGWTVAALVQANFGGVLQVLGLPLGQELGRHYLAGHVVPDGPDGSIMIVVATDAPVSDRNLTRLARRALAGLARTGASMSNSSGDYVIAFANSPAVRRTRQRRRAVTSIPDLPNEAMSPLFQGVIEATEEAIYNSLFMAAPVHGYLGRSADVLPLARVLEALDHRPGRRSRLGPESSPAQSTQERNKDTPVP